MIHSYSLTTKNSTFEEKWNCLALRYELLDHHSVYQVFESKAHIKQTEWP
jgi:hypothetical protein